MYCVYLLLNEANGRTYVGATRCFERRLVQHNEGVGSNATAQDAGHWICIIQVQNFRSWASAVRFENCLHRPWLVGLEVYGITTSRAAHSLTNRLCALKQLIKLYAVTEQTKICVLDEGLVVILEQFLFDIIFVY